MNDEDSRSSKESQKGTNNWNELYKDYPYLPTEMHIEQKGDFGLPRWYCIRKLSKLRMWEDVHTLNDASFRISLRIKYVNLYVFLVVYIYIQLRI